MKELAVLDLAEAELAYLSACSTAQTARRIPDESIHVASAFHLAGFRHVIGSRALNRLWGALGTIGRLDHALGVLRPGNENN